MISLVRRGGRIPLWTLALAIWGFCGSLATCHGDGVDAPDPQANCPTGFGTLGWGPPGCQPGFQGFGLFFHRGHGYGGDSLGVGAEGGYPFYGGPGYLHPSPPLRRCGPATPFAYSGNPGPPHGFILPGTLVVHDPVVMQTNGRESGADGGALFAFDVGFGPFTGALPYPESFFAPYASAAAAGEFTSTTGSPGPAAPATPAPRARDLGIDLEPIVDNAGARRLRITLVHPGTAAETAGLRPGDIILSINGYRLEQRGNLEWIIAHAAPDGVLAIKARLALDGKERTVTARLP